MSSLVRIEANRANAAKSTGPRTAEGKRVVAANAARSTGPRTPEGKARSSQNATQHGLLSNSLVLRGECSQSFQSAIAELTAELRPRTYVERQFVEVMTMANWRRRRLWHIEATHFNRAIREEEENSAQQASGAPAAHENSGDSATHTALAFRTLCDDTKILKNLHRYEVRFSREYTRHLNLFEARRARASGNVDFSKRTKAKIG